MGTVFTVALQEYLLRQPTRAFTNLYLLNFSRMANILPMMNKIVCIHVGFSPKFFIFFCLYICIIV